LLCTGLVGLVGVIGVARSTKSSICEFIWFSAWFRDLTLPLAVVDRSPVSVIKTLLAEQHGPLHTEIEHMKIFTMSHLVDSVDSVDLMQWNEIKLHNYLCVVVVVSV
jgi:hypothetical protein